MYRASRVQWNVDYSLLYWLTYSASVISTTADTQHERSATALKPDATETMYCMSVNICKSFIGMIHTIQYIWFI